MDQSVIYFPIHSTVYYMPGTLPIPLVSLFLSVPLLLGDHLLSSFQNFPFVSGTRAGQKEAFFSFSGPFSQ
jgi:hypothetical protein